MKKALVLAIIILLLALDWVALYDILKGNEANFYLEYGLLTLSALIFGFIVYFKIKKPALPSKSKILLYFTILFLLISALISLLNKNYEFLYYTAVLSGLITVIILYHKKFHVPSGIIIGLSIIGILYVLGGNLYLNQIRLFDLYLIPGLFKYDNLIHLLFTFVATFIAYSLLSPYLYKKLIHNRIILSLILVLIALGVGAIIEIVELLGVVFFNTSERVGDYINNALDLVFNFIGALIACFFLMYHHRKREE